MKLNSAALSDRAAWKNADFALPEFDVNAMIANTDRAPRWLHFGAGNIFRAFPAAAMQRLLDKGLADTGIVACECFDGDIIDKAYAPFDNLSVCVTLRCDGTVEKRVIASVAKSLRCDGTNAKDDAALESVFCSPSLQMVTFTITEKGYAVNSFVKADAENEPAAAKTIIGKVTALLARRFAAGAVPIALVSMDNCSKNGEKLKTAVMTIADAWLEKGYISAQCHAYIADEEKVAFPWTMIDKITPRPDANVARMLSDSGFEDTETIITDKHTYTAAFVNAEQAEYLVIEDRFPNGRLPLEKAQLYFTDRETVNKVERMKVTTCLNPLHTALAVLGCVLKFPTIASEMADADLSALVKKLAYEEGMPVVTDPGILSPMAFASEVINVRLPNPFMPDTPQRIATDTSQKLSVRFGETVKSYMASDTLDSASLRYIPFVYAAWMRYLTAIDDEGNAFTLSPDPLLESLEGDIAQLKNGMIPSSLLERSDIFGVSLREAGLEEKVADNLRNLLSGSGAVRKALHALVAE